LTLKEGVSWEATLQIKTSGYSCMNAFTVNLMQVDVDEFYPILKKNETDS